MVSYTFLVIDLVTSIIALLLYSWAFKTLRKYAEAEYKRGYSEASSKHAAELAEFDKRLEAAQASMTSLNNKLDGYETRSHEKIRRFEN